MAWDKSRLGVQVKTSMIGIIFSIALSAQGQTLSSYCQLQTDEMVGLASEELSLVQKIEKCIKIHIFQKTSQYFSHTFSQSDGRYVYFNATPKGDALFSERQFTNSDGDFYYLRKESDNDKTFFSTRQFIHPDGKFTLFRKNKTNEETLFSIREFTQGKNKLIYFRRNSDDQKTLFSVKIFSEDGHPIIYFRRGKDDNDTLVSIKDRVFRNANKDPMTPHQFYQKLKSEIWEPLVIELVLPALAAVDAQLI
jgi:hypothetical protein